MGLHFPNRVGLAAGLDKNGAHIDGLAKLGFGFIEVGRTDLQAFKTASLVFGKGAEAGSYSEREDIVTLGCFSSSLWKWREIEGDECNVAGDPRRNYPHWRRRNAHSQRKRDFFEYGHRPIRKLYVSTLTG